MVEYIRDIAEEKETTPAQIALAWVLASKSWIVPIPGTRKIQRLDENIGSVDIELSTEEIKRINDALNHIPILGDRYPEELAKRVDK